MLLMMSENIARNMWSSQGIINYPTQLHLVGHFPISYHDAWKHEYQISMMSCMQDIKIPSLSKCIFIKLMEILRYILKIPTIQATNPEGSTFLTPKPHMRNYPEPLLSMSHPHNHFFNTDPNATLPP